MDQPHDIFDPQPIDNACETVVEGSVSASPSFPALAADVAVEPRPDSWTDMQWRFVAAYCANGGDGKAAAELAGYGGGAANMAVRNLLKPKVQDEIERRVKAGRGTILLKAMARAMKIIESSTDDRAAGAMVLGMMDRFGMAPPRGPAVVVNNNMGNPADMALQILADLVARREERIKRIGPGSMSGIPAAMPDNSEASDG